MGQARYSNPKQEPPVSASKLTAKVMHFEENKHFLLVEAGHMFEKGPNGRPEM